MSLLPLLHKGLYISELQKKLGETLPPIPASTCVQDKEAHSPIPLMLDIHIVTSAPDPPQTRNFLSQLHFGVLFLLTPPKTLRHELLSTEKLIHFRWPFSFWQNQIVFRGYRKALLTWNGLTKIVNLSVKFFIFWWLLLNHSLNKPAKFHVNFTL